MTTDHTVSDAIALPKWFVSFLSVLFSLIGVGFATWSFSVSNDIAAIKTELRVANDGRAQEMNDIRRRLDRLEKYP